MIAWLKRLFGAPMSPDFTVTSPEFTEMAELSQAIITRSANITDEIHRLERKLRVKRKA